MAKEISESSLNVAPEEQR